MSDKKKIEFADSVYELAKRCLRNKTPMFYGNIYKGLVDKYEREVITVVTKQRGEKE